MAASNEIEIGHSDLTPVVRKALGSGIAVPTGWRVERLAGGQGPSTHAVYRIAGDALDGGQKIPWSVVLKVINLPEGEGRAYFIEETQPLYWKREALAYQSDLLRDLPGGIAAPSCYSITRGKANSLWLWLEEVRDVYSSGWPLEQYARAAYCLGLFNGAYLAGRPIADYPWLVLTGSPRGLLNGNLWIRHLIARTDSWKHTLVRSAFPVPIADKLLRLWDEREALLRVLDRVPQTFAHLDAWRMNMVWRSQEQKPEDLTLIDWAFPGRGPVAIDAGDLFHESFNLAELSNVDPRDFDRAIYESYLDGLCAAGWKGDERVVRFAFTAFCALKHGCALFWLGDLSNEKRQAVWESIFKLPFADFIAREARLLYYLLELVDEAQRLTDCVSP